MGFHFRSLVHRDHATSGDARLSCLALSPDGSTLATGRQAGCAAAAKYYSSIDFLAAPGWITGRLTVFSLFPSKALRATPPRRSHGSPNSGETDPIDRVPRVARGMLEVCSLRPASSRVFRRHDWPRASHDYDRHRTGEPLLPPCHSSAAGEGRVNDTVAGVAGDLSRRGRHHKLGHGAVHPE
jgi:hypothetical protein